MEQDKTGNNEAYETNVENVENENVENENVENENVAQQKLFEAKKEIETLKAKIDVISANMKNDVEINKELEEELEKLKYDDPELWRVKINNLEKEAYERRKNAIDEATKEVERKIELERRKEILEEFNRKNKDIVITDDIIKYDIPPRITAKLEKGEISFEQFLHEVKNFIEAPKTISTDKNVNSQPDITNVGGASTPNRAVNNTSSIEVYKSAIL